MEIVIITGISTSGKTTLSSTFNDVVLHIDDYYHYPTLTLNLEPLLNLYQIQPKKIIFDGYIFTDENIRILFDIFGKDTVLKIIFLYQFPLDYYYSLMNDSCGDKYCPSGEPHDYEYVTRKICGDIISLNNTVKKIPNVSSISYKRRCGNRYWDFNDDSDMLKILNRNSKEIVLDYIDATSGDPKYQTIVFNNEVIRYGNERCHLSWENIMKTGINLFPP